MPEAEIVVAQEKTGDAQDTLPAADDLELWILECAVDLERNNLCLGEGLDERPGLHEELAKKQRTLQAILDASPVGIGLVAADLTHGWCNQAMSDISGYPPSELVGAKPSLLIRLPQEQAKVALQVQAILLGREKGPILATWTRKDGEQREVKIHLRALDPMDLDQGFIATVMDITEQIRAQRNLKQRQKTLRAILDASPVSILWTRNRILERVNTAMCMLLGYERHELEGQKSRMLYLSGAEYARIGSAAAECGYSAQGELECQWVCKDGRVIDVHIRWRLLEADRLEDGYIVTAEDITQRKQDEKRIKDYQDKLRQLALEESRTEEQERQRLAETVHDGLGQTLTLIRIGLKSVLAQRPRRRERGLRELVKLVDQAFQETRKVTAELSPPILRELGLEAGLAWLADHTFQRYGAVTHFHSDWESTGLSRETVVPLYRVTQELVMNAVKHGSPGLIEISLARHEGDLQIIVQDDGQGFDISTLDTYVPHGFGLFSVKERISSLGGGFRIGSRPGVGTIAKITAPLGPPER